jgi:ribosomal protein L19E
MIANLKTRVRTLVRKDYTESGDFQKQLEHTLSSMKEGRSQGQGKHKGRRTAFANKRHIWAIELLEHYESLLNTDL